MITKAPGLNIEDAVFELEDGIISAVAAAAHFDALAVRLRMFLPIGPASDLAAPLEALARAVRDLVINAGDGVREQIMSCGIPSDDVACGSCGSPDFETRDCAACAAIRSDGWRLARQRCGWNL